MNETPAQKIQAMRKAIKTLKKSKDFEMVIRCKVIIAYLSGKPVKKIAGYFDISEKTVGRWIAKYNDGGIEALGIKPRSGRPPKINTDQLMEVKKVIELDQERVWVARHVYS